MEPRQHDITRNEHERRREILKTLKKYFASKELQEDKVAESTQQLSHLEHVLEFSATWNGVLTADFFPDAPDMHTFLMAQGMTRLGMFFEKPFTEVSKALREKGTEYPFLLKKLYETYYLSSIHRNTAAKARASPMQ